ncbi:Na(+)/H(+) antiporter NhaA [compost metagenome]
MIKSFTKIVRWPIETFLKMEASSGIVLALCAGLAMFTANSVWAPEYFNLLHTHILGLSLQHWINDGLMAIFFFVIGMEIKKEILVGELSTVKKAILPVAAAIGGMIFPALIYYFFNPSAPSANGWGVPMATDIAFALGILTLFGKRVPLALKIFLLALAIVDDLGAVLVIAIFYTKEIRFEGLLAATAALGIMWFMRRMGIKSYLAYTAWGAVAWFGVLFSGVHATVAGVLIGLLTPLTFKVSRQSHLTYSPLETLVHWLHPWVSFGIMPIFALANAGITLRGIEISELIQNPIHQGVALGLVVGKPVGIFVFSRLSVLLRWGSLPSGISWSHILGAGFLGGIGFTMALFISNLALAAEFEIYSKTGIIFGSVLSGVLGSLVLAVALSSKANSKAEV